MNEAQPFVKHHRRASTDVQRKTPQCMIFGCSKKSDDPCCYFCVKKIECGEDACKNSPDRCGKCLMPQKMKEEAKAMNRYDIPDHPAIAHAERFGGGAYHLNGNESPVCPECKSECLICYVDRSGEIVGCENCISSKNAASFIGRNQE